MQNNIYIYQMDYSILKYNGKIYRIKKQPFETQEQVMDRLWYIVKIGGDSLKWMYQKYLGVTY